MSAQHVCIALILLLYAACGHGLESAEDYDDVDEPAYHYDEMECPSLGDTFLAEKQIPWGYPDRAILAMPSEVRLMESRIEGAGLGVFAKTFIRKYTWLGEYEGEVLHEDDDKSEYAFDCWRGGRMSHTVDAYDVRTSNWVRFLNCAHGCRDENVVVRDCRGRVFLMALRDIRPGEEMLFWYGHEYAEERLGLQYESCEEEEEEEWEEE